MTAKISIALSKGDWEMLLMLLHKYEGVVDSQPLLSWLKQTQRTIRNEVEKPHTQRGNGNREFSEDDLGYVPYNPRWNDPDVDPGEKYSDSDWWITHTQDDEI